MSPTATPPERIADPGRCACGAKVVRGLDNTGQLVTISLHSDLDAAAELLAHTRGTPTFTLALARPRGLTITRRTPQQIVRKPAGFTRDRIVPAHTCRTPHTTTEDKAT